jgi:serine/threonine protein kinase
MRYGQYGGISMGRREKEIDPDAGPLHAFAADLRELRRQAPGSPSYRALSQRAGFSAAALNAAASAEKLPTLDVTLAFVGACGGDSAAWERRWHELAALLRATNPELLAESDSKKPESPSAPPAGTGASSGAEAAESAANSGAVESGAAKSGAAGGDSGEPGGNSSAPGGNSGGPSADGLVPDDEWRVEPLHDGDPSVVGPYRLVGRLGSGAMGRVYLGATAAGRPVAVKVVRSELADDSAFRKRFRREVAAARQVTSLYTAAVLDADTEAGSPWLATAFFPGPSLEELVNSGGTLTSGALRRLAAGIAEALTAIHAAGIVHRDLKPANVLLSADGPQVIDFGIARAADASRLTATGARVGTPAFLPPEQAEHGESLPAGDVFSLGALLVYAATGTTPFGEGSTSAVLYRVVHQEPDLSGLRDLDKDLREVITACLAKNPAARPTPEQIIQRCADGPDTAGHGGLAGVLAGVIARRRRLAEQAIAGRPARSAQHSTLGPKGRKRLIQSSIALPALIAIAVVTLIATHGGGRPDQADSGGTNSSAGATTGGVNLDPQGPSTSPPVTRSPSPSTTHPADPGPYTPPTANPVAPPVPAPTHTANAANLSACSGSGITCYSPQVTAVDSGSTHCPAAQAWHTTTDSTGAAVDYANANGPYECTSVLYSPRITSATCSYSFYIPHGVGNTRIFIAYYQNGSSTKQWFSTVDESTESGWVTIGSATEVTQIGFQDNNGKPTQQVLAWGAKASDGIRQLCA